MNGSKDTRYSDLRVLFHWHAKPGPPAMSSRQVMVGPSYETVESPDGFISINVPFGSYDIRSVVDRLPTHQRPDVLLVAIDSTKTSVPRNLDALDCPKALLLGDTHHLDAPIRFAYSYLLAERFDVIVGNHLPQHLHFFWHAQRGRIIWIPGIWVRNYGLPFSESRPRPAVFVGQVGDYHPVRRHLIEQARAAGIPLEVGTMAQDQAARRYNEAVITLNCSLNGDINMRVFETLGHGGFLLSDALTPEAGLTRLFTDGDTLACYRGAADLIEKMRFYLARPSEALEIARRGFRLYEREHRPEHKQAQLFSALFADGRYPAPEWHDARAEAPQPGEAHALLPRVQVYEYMQELHRTIDRLAAIAMPSVDARTITDLLDLNRLVLGRDGGLGSDARAAAVRRLGFADRLADPDCVPHVVLASASDLTDAGGSARLAAIRAERIVIVGRGDVGPAGDVAAAALGPYRRVSDAPVVYARI